MEAARIAIIPTPVRLAEATSRLAQFAIDRARLLPRVTPSVPAAPSDLHLPREAGALNEADSKAVLARFGIATTREVVVPVGGNIRASTKCLKSPFAVKVVAADIAHKSDVGGVQLNIAAGEALEKAAATVVANARSAKPDARIDGVLVAEMASGLEVLVGVINDEAFGPTVALGLGGVLTEILGDIVYRIAPFEIDTANDMIAELKGARLFDGYRGTKPADRQALAEMLVTVSQMAMTLRGGIAEMDLNPVFVGAVGQGVVVADALVVLR